MGKNQSFIFKASVLFLMHHKYKQNVYCVVTPSLRGRKKPGAQSTAEFPRLKPPENADGRFRSAAACSGGSYETSRLTGVLKNRLFTHFSAVTLPK